MKIGIAGIGGIGSSVARHLAQAGAASLKIVDFDRVEFSNLNRQFYRIDQVGLKKTACLKDNLLAVNPSMIIEAVDETIGRGNAAQLFRDCSIVVEGLDHRNLKKMLIEELSGAGKKIVSASGIAGRNMEGVTVRTFGPCRIVGDFVSDQEEHELFAPKIALVAAHMAGIVLEWIRGNPPAGKPQGGKG